MVDRNYRDFSSDLRELVLASDSDSDLEGNLSLDVDVNIPNLNNVNIHIYIVIFQWLDQIFLMRNVC